MQTSQVIFLIAYSFGMAVGQILFKLAAQSILKGKSGNSLVSYFNGYFCAAVILYFGLSLLWVWLLRFVPLSRAYPFVVLAFIFTPLLAALVLDETLSANYLLGLGLVVAGLFIIVR